MSQGGRPRRIDEKEKRLLRQLVEDKPLATLDEITGAFCQQTGLSVHHMTVRGAWTRWTFDVSARRYPPIKVSQSGVMANSRPIVVNARRVLPQFSDR